MKIEQKLIKIQKKIRKQCIKVIKSEKINLQQRINIEGSNKLQDMQIRKINNVSSIYEMRNGEYRHGIRSNNDPQIKLAHDKNNRLEYVICNELLGYQKTEYKQKEKVYHKIQLLQPKLLQIRNRTVNNTDSVFMKNEANNKSLTNSKKIESLLLEKSRLTQQSERNHVSNESPNKKSINQKSFINNSPFNSISNFKLTSSFNQHNTSNYSPFSQYYNEINQKESEINIKPYQNTRWKHFQQSPDKQITKSAQNINLKQSRLMKLSTNKAINSGIKIIQIPLGYQMQDLIPVLSVSKIQQSYHQPYFLQNNKLLYQSIRQNKDQIQNKGQVQNKSQINYVNKLVTLFDLKNSQSQDDLNASYHSIHHSDSNNEFISHFNFGKATQSKIIQSDIKKSKNLQSDIKKSKTIETDYKSQNRSDNKYQNKKLNRLLKKGSQNSQICNSVIEESDKQQMDNMKFQYKRINKDRRGLSQRKIIVNQHQQQQSKPKSIRGLRKTGKVKQINEIRQVKFLDQIQKKLQTPKFGKNFSFK